MDASFYYGMDAPYVRPYSIEHILYLVVCAAIIFLFIRNRRGIRAQRDKVGRVFLAILLFQQVVLLYGWYAVATGYDLSVSLPFHICRMASLLTIVFLLSKKMVFMDVVCYFSIFALISFFYPMNVYHFAHVSGLSYMVNHLLTVLVPIFAVVAYDWRPTWRSYRNAAVGFTAYFAIAVAVNALVPGGNYFYQTDRPFLRSMPQWQFSALSYLVTLAGFALVPLVYGLFAKRAQSKQVPKREIERPNGAKS